MSASSFTVLEASRGGLPAIIVVDTALEPETDRQRFPWLLTMSLEIQERSPDGLCSERESEELGRKEEALLGALSCKSRYVGRVTWNGTRDVMLYVEDADRACREIEAGPAFPGSSVVRLAADYDPEWEGFRRFVP